MHTATQNLITQALADFGVSALAILSVVITIGVGLLVFYFGWRKLSNMAVGADIGMNIGGRLDYQEPVYSDNGWTYKGVFHPYKIRKEHF